MTEREYVGSVSGWAAKQLPHQSRKCHTHLSPGAAITCSNFLNLNAESADLLVRLKEESHEERKLDVVRIKQE